MESLISFIIATVLLAIMPGPDIIYVLVQSITNGKKYGIATALGLVSGIIVHTTLVAFGVSALIKQSENLFFTIKLFGALYLLYLAYTAYISNEELLLQNKTDKKGLLQLFKQGFIMNVLNPKVSIFFLAFFPGFLYSEKQNTIIQFYVLGFLFSVVSFSIFCLIALLGGKVSLYLQKHKKSGFYLKWLQIFVFLSIAFLIFFNS